MNPTSETLLAHENNEKIAELTESIRCLFENIPGPTFSKDATTGVYLACNQAFAEYAHKEDPQGVVGLTDFEIFDPDTAAHFVEDDRKALSMDEPYVFFEDVFDAAGNPKQFQTTKLKYTDSQGRLCSLGLCLDVTDLVAARRETLEAKGELEKARDASATYFNIARALSADYIHIYYVDLESDDYVEYQRPSSTHTISLERAGKDFFSSSRTEARAVLYEKDVALFCEAFTKEKVLAAVRENGMFTLSYRQMVGGNPTYMGLKATFNEDYPSHLVVGVNNIDAQMRQRQALQRLREEQATFARVSALSGDYLAMYIVDPDTNSYVQYSATPSYEALGLKQSGDDFFADSIRQGQTAIVPEDLELFSSMLTKENVLSEIQQHGLFLINYRLMMAGTPLYVNLRAALVEESDGPRLIAGVSNVDAQVKREQAFKVAQVRASKDSLTGVKNKHAYVDIENQLNARIEAGEDLEFAVVMFDINDLKLVNDSQGHQAGDEFIKQACTLVCTVFDHSPVFRIGGDEFCVISQGSDYENVDVLVQRIEMRNRRNAQTGEPILACGLAKYQGESSVDAVFARADAAMYANKRAMKGQD